MAGRLNSLLAGLGLAVLLGAALTGCASAAGTAASTTPSASTEIDVDAAWLDDGRIIGLVTQGSSTCIPTAGDATLQADGSLAVTLVEPDATAVCTRDLVPRVTLVDVPEGVDPSKDLPITVSGDGYKATTDLAGAAGLTGGGMTDYLPTAGLTDEDNLIVLLTWGSSTCVPAISDVAVAGADVTVTFQTPPADQVCTADMAPRATIVEAAGLEADVNVTLILTGSPEFDNVRVAVSGSN